MPEGLNQESNSPRMELHRIVKETLIAARSTAHDAKERQEKAEKELEELLNKHPEFVDMVEKVQDDITKTLK
jgi:ABC-type microcin C transport system duplicated ATPase subunit YejF